MFKDFDSSNSASWGHLAGLSKEELENIIKSNNSSKTIKLMSKHKLYKVTLIRSYTFEQEGESFIVSAESESMAHYIAEKQDNAQYYPKSHPDFSSIAPRVTTRYKITKT